MGSCVIQCNVPHPWIAQRQALSWYYIRCLKAMLNPKKQNTHIRFFDRFEWIFFLHNNLKKRFIWTWGLKCWDHIGPMNIPINKLFWLLVYYNFHTRRFFKNKTWTAWKTWLLSMWVKLPAETFWCAFLIVKKQYNHGRDQDWLIFW